MKIYCDNPVIILNPSFKDIVLKWRHYQIADSICTLSYASVSAWKLSFPYGNFSKYKTHVTLENIDSYYAFNPETSETIPMYIQVPCTKCILCREKSSREWSFRALCENNSSTSEPLFLTLTYNNEHLPKHGIFKEELQLFFKRLRIHLDRKKIPHNIRYFACGEYGTKSGRPHYHAILWNFPEMKTLAQRLRFIENAWRLPTGEYASDGSPETKSIGFAYCVPARQGAISYVMKYMRKTPVVPNGCQPNFFLSSRKNGGIGASYGRKYMDFYRKNPNVLEMTVTDQYSGKTVTASMPAYFKNMFFPCMSNLVSKETRYAYKTFCYLLSKRYTIANRLDGGVPHLTSYEKALLRKYYFLPTHISTHVDVGYDRCLRHYSDDQLVNLYAQNEFEIQSLVRYLQIEYIDTSYIAWRNDILSKRTQSMNSKYLNKPEIDIESVKISIKSANDLAIAKEII